MKAIQQRDVIENIYNIYVSDKSIRHKKEEYDGWFSASSAGKCYREQWYIRNGYEPSEMDERVKRLLRLGTLVHKDLEEAIKYAQLNLPIYPKEKILTEYEVEIPELKVLGHLDVAVIYEKEKRIDIYDLKTTGAYKWRILFGRKPDPNPSFMYELQIGTYAFGLMSMGYDNYDYTLSLIYYNKDTSAMKVVKKDSDHWIDKAIEYWTDLGETLNDIKKDTDLIPGVSMATPMYNWQCRYCGFKEHCSGI